MIKKDASLDALLRAALREDTGNQDLTSRLLPPSQSARADAVFNEDGILCGIEVAEKIFRLADSEIRFLPTVKDGDFIEKGRVVFYVEGKSRSILAAERSVLNFLGRMSGIATLTRKYVEQVKGTQATIYDTRKTLPLWRRLDREAVKVGGGENHRFGLYDGILVKDNHLRMLKGIKPPDLLKQIHQHISKRIPVGIEVANPKEAKEALSHWFDYVLLDNFSLEEVRQTVALRAEIGTNIPLEVSGNIRLDNVRAYAECGVERISVGALTHSACSLDVSLNLI